MPKRKPGLNPKQRAILPSEGKFLRKHALEYLLIAIVAAVAVIGVLRHVGN